MFTQNGNFIVKYNMKKNIILKFGGTSLATPESIKLVRSIIETTKNVKAVIVSAPGKSEKFQMKVTDALILAHVDKNKFNFYIGYVKKVYENIIAGLGIYFELEYEFEKILQTYRNNNSRSFLVSRGEYLSAKIIAKFLDVEFVDAKDIILFSKNGKILKKTYKNIQKRLKNKQNVIIPGFYGSSIFGKIKIMCRGGSDISGSIIANSFKRSEYQNYTDVDGVYDIFAKNKENGTIIHRISYKNMQFLSFYGCNILHYKCSSVFTKGETIIKNTFNSKARGTIVSSKFELDSNMISSTLGLQIEFDEKDRKVKSLLKKLKHEKLYSFVRMGSVFYGMRLSVNDYNDRVFDKLKARIYNIYDIKVYAIIGDISVWMKCIKDKGENLIIQFCNENKTNLVYML